MGESPSAHASGVDVVASVRATLVSLRDITTSGELSAALTATADSQLIGVLTELRELRATVAAIEASVQCAFDEQQRLAAAQRGMPKSDQGKGVADQIALARGVSVYRAANDLALARGLVRELPATFARLARGHLNEQAAMAVARETVCLMPDDRAIVDQRVAPKLRIGTAARRAAALARAESARVDAESVTARIRMAESQRCVTVRPAPDAMVYLSALMPVKDGVAAYAALDRHATAAKATGDERSRGAIMADELFSRLTGVASADEVPVEIQLVMPADTLLRAAESTAVGEVPGRIAEQVIPAQVCREIALIPDENARRWVRRIFTDPVSGQVRDVDERRRLFTGAMPEAILLRDQACRTCGAPVREVDHVTAYADGGVTTKRNGQALCKRCNLTKTLPGWVSRSFEIDGSHVVLTKTPTGRRYLSEAPPVLPGWAPIAASEARDGPAETRAGPVERALASASHLLSGHGDSDVHP